MRRGILLLNFPARRESPRRLKREKSPPSRAFRLAGPENFISNEKCFSLLLTLDKQFQFLLSFSLSLLFLSWIKSNRKKHLESDTLLFVRASTREP